MKTFGLRTNNANTWFIHTGNFWYVPQGVVGNKHLSEIRLYVSFCYRLSVVKHQVNLYIYLVICCLSPSSTTEPYTPKDSNVVCYLSVRLKI